MGKETLFDTRFFAENTDPSVIDFIRSKGWKITSEEVDTPNFKDPYIVYSPYLDHFWTSNCSKDELLDSGDDELTPEEFKERIGMTTKENLTEFPTLEAGKHIVRIGNTKWGYYLANDVVAWVNYVGQSNSGWDKYPEVADEITHVYLIQRDIFPHIGFSKCIWDATNVKSDNIRKELQFAEAKKERLEKHIEVLKSKLQ